MLVLVPFRIVTDNPKTNAIFNKLPEDVQDYIIGASDNFQSQTIIPLLESSEADFPMKFTESAGHLGNYVIQIGTFLVEKQKTHSNLMIDLLEFYMSSFEAIKNVVEDLPDNVSDQITNVLEILLNYISMTTDPKMFDEITKPEYEPALGFYFGLLLSISALIAIFKYGNKSHEQKVSILLEYCNHYAKELESYTETIEIESNPDDMKRLEKINTV